MHFDDRLATVLRSRLASTAGARIQYRQLIDLLGTGAAEARSAQLDSAYVRLGELAEAIPAPQRAVIAGDRGLRIRSPRLLSVLAHGDPRVFAAAIARAQLKQEQWLDLVPALPVQARGLIRHRRDLGQDVEHLLARLGIRDRGLPQPQETEAGRFPATDAPPPFAETDSIGSLVKRIEAFRRARRETGEPASASTDAPRLPLGEEALIRPPRHLSSFDFASDTAGRIVWADPGVAPQVVGMGIATCDPIASVQTPYHVARSFQRRQPIRAGHLLIAGAPAIAGDWQIDAAPAFDPLSGRFTGYRGRLRRPVEPAQPRSPAPDTGSDRMRQLLHELRTPVNAIQGFAEIIQQQLFGPAPHEYRALAASIAADGAHMLAGFEELERLARLDSGAIDLEEGECDFKSIVTNIVKQLEHHTRPRSSGFAIKTEDAALIVPLAGIEAERLVWRLLATLAGTAVPGEVLKIKLRRHGEAIRMSMHLPAGLASRDDEALFNATTASAPQAISAGMFGAGFALRLAASEARAAGGSLERRESRLRLTLPGLTRPANTHSQHAVDRVRGSHPAA